MHSGVKSLKLAPVTAGLRKNSCKRILVHASKRTAVVAIQNVSVFDFGSWCCSLASFLPRGWHLCDGSPCCSCRNGRDGRCWSACGGDPRQWRPVTTIPSDSDVDYLSSGEEERLDKVFLGVGKPGDEVLGDSSQSEAKDWDDEPDEGTVRGSGTTTAISSLLWHGN